MDNLYCLFSWRLSCCGASETPYLPRGLDALDDGQTDQDPGHQQAQGHLPVQPAAVVDAAGDVESLSVPEVSGGRTLLALWLHNCDRKGGKSTNNTKCMMYDGNDGVW